MKNPFARASILAPRFVMAAALGAALILALGACTPKKPKIWIYTSIYKEVVEEMKPELQAAVPDADIEWFQNGSENVAAKLNAEIAAGKPKADLVLTSDPFWYLELKRTGHLLNYISAIQKDLPAGYADPEGAFATVRLPVMVIGYNSKTMTEADLPKTWKALAEAKYAGKLTMPSPLESGSAFTAVALLSKKLGWDYFKDLRKLNVLAAGGNGAVISRMETNERPLGIVLLENILKAQTKGSPIKAIYPEDGVIPVVSPIAILKETEHPELAKKVYDWFYIEAAQKAMVKSGMYPALAAIPSPVGARTLAEVQKQMMPWNPQILDELFGQRDTIKNRFTEIVLH